MRSPQTLCIISALLMCSTSVFAQTTGAMEENPAAKSAPAMGSMQMTGDSDKDFAMMMKTHHEKGLEMAKQEVAAGKSPQMKAMAQKIVDSQTKEIAELDKWLAAHK